MRLVAEVDCGDGAVMTIVDPRSLKDGGAEWQMRYGNPVAIRYVVASLIESFDYLISDNINMNEATRRLRLMRRRRAALRLAEGES